MDTLKITAYTDPLCSWCYGQEPALTALGFSLGDQLELHNVMGLMLPDVRVMIGADDAGLPDGDILRKGRLPEQTEKAVRDGFVLQLHSLKSEAHFP